MDGSGVRGIALGSGLPAGVAGGSGGVGTRLA